MARFPIAYVGLLWAITLTHPVLAADHFTPTTGLQYLKAASESVTSCDVSYRVEFKRSLVSVLDESTHERKVRRPLPGEVFLPETNTYRMICDRGKYRYESLDSVTGNIEWICVIIGSDWRYKEFNGRSGPSFTIRQKTMPPGGSWRDYREFLGTHFSDYLLHQMLSDRSSLRTIQDQEGKIILEADPEPDRHISGRLNGYRVVMNPKLGLMVEELVEIYKGLPKRKNEIIEWHPFAKGSFAPVRMRATGYQAADRELPGEVFCTYELLVDVSRSSWNRPINPSLF